MAFDEKSEGLRAIVHRGVKTPPPPISKTPPLPFWVTTPFLKILESPTFKATFSSDLKFYSTA